MNNKISKLAADAGIGATWENIETEATSIVGKRIRRLRKRGYLREGYESFRSMVIECHDLIAGACLKVSSSKQGYETTLETVVPRLLIALIQNRLKRNATEIGEPETTHFQRAMALLSQRIDRAAMTEPAAEKERFLYRQLVIPLEDDIAEERAKWKYRALKPRVAGNSSGRDAKMTLAVGNRFRRQGETWDLMFNGKTAAVPHLVGMVYIAHLLRSPQKEIQALAILSPDHLKKKSMAMGGIELADSTAVQEVQRELKRYQTELAGLAKSDWARRGPLMEKIPKLEQYLSQVRGLAGSKRKAGGDHARARGTVTNGIQRAIRKITKIHPEMADHLSKRIKTGTVLMYSPEEPVDWQL